MDTREGSSGMIQPANMKRILKDIKALEECSIDGISVHINEANVTEIDTEYMGPEGTPYEGGLFRMRLSIGAEYPHAPPKGRFLTKIFHPNVSSTGDICVNVLKRDWKPDMGLSHILSVIRCLLIEPNAESALNEEAGKLLLEGFGEFAAKAKMMTEIHATKKSVLTDMNAAGTASGDRDGTEKKNAGDDVMKKLESAVKKPPARSLNMKKKSLRRL